jgi:hypothetical protein
MRILWNLGSKIISNLKQMQGNIMDLTEVTSSYENLLKSI